jgi:uracil-DNA glycosylase family 4
MRNESCKKCDLGLQGCHSVCLWGVGGTKPKLMIVGESPSQDDDNVGAPFSGRMGRILDHILGYWSLDREEIYFTNVIKCRPSSGKLPGKKADREEIIESCMTYFDEEFQAVKPRAILALGVTALQALTEGDAVDIATWQGREWGRYGSARLFVGYHPGFLMKKPSQERYLSATVMMAAIAAGLKPSHKLGHPPFDYDAY